MIEKRGRQLAGCVDLDKFEGIPSSSREAVTSLAGIIVNNYMVEQNRDHNSAASNQNEQISL